ncbi:ABC transporter permease [Aeromicrobium wangtongii]|uniref:ABC transporter permease n=1 Tax=Aeromicrobium wangtongii TaxID=2969247 RepID=UPI0020170183|nr:ABC transporter permease subunit [Aeromicrobium wangtongii]MCL3816936.1 ABC transporter permease subunit [Aeromicrobium wangtongii]
MRRDADLSDPISRSRGRVRAVVMSVGRLVITVLVIGVLWNGLRILGVLPTDQVPAAGTVVRTTVSLLGDGTLVDPLGETVRAFLAGLAASVVIGVPLGFLVGRLQLADDALGLTLDLLRPIPAVALVPVAVVVLGLGLTMQVALIAFASIWPIVYNTRYGARNIDPLLVDASRLVGLSRTAMAWRVLLPAALPSIMTGVRLAAAVAVVLTIVTELVASGTGLGYFVSTTQQAGDNDSAFAGVLLAALLGTVVNALVRLMEQRLTSWHTHRQALT